MTDQHIERRSPLVLLVNGQEWTARSVESVLRPAGYAVVMAYTGRQAKELAARLRPDLVIVDYRLPDSLCLDTCRDIRALPTVDRATPFIIATAASLSRRERHECLKGGIWDIFSSPFDPVELLSKLETFLGAHRQVESAWEATHSDPATGLYNWNGLLARAVELVADAHRCGRWTGCVAVGPRKDDPGRAEMFGRISMTLAEATRDSDPTGVLGADDFLVLAPGTDVAGAAILAKRLVDILNQRATPKGHPQPDLEFGAGYYAALDEKGGSVLGQDLLLRTVEALHTVRKAEPGSPAILPFHLA